MKRKEPRDPGAAISRRTLVHGMAVAAGATVVGAGGALAQQGGQLGPPSTITSPPRDFSPGGAPTTYFWDPDIIAALYRIVVGRGSGLELAGPLSAVERHPQ